MMSQKTKREWPPGDGSSERLTAAALFSHASTAASLMWSNRFMLAMRKCAIVCRFSVRRASLVLWWRWAWQLSNMTMVVDYISRKLGNILVISCFITKTSSPELCQETTLRQYSFKGCSVLGGWFSIVQTWFRWFRWFGLVGEMVQILCLSDLVFIILFTLKIKVRSICFLCFQMWSRLWRAFWQTEQLEEDILFIGPRSRLGIF